MFGTLFFLFHRYPSIISAISHQPFTISHLPLHIESLIFTAANPITLGEIKHVLQSTFQTDFSDQDILGALEELKNKYASQLFSFEIVEIGEGYRFLTKSSYHNTIGTYLKWTTPKRLSQSALETLSIIAYKQPVSKSDLEQIRGVSCDYAIQKLLEKELIAIQGRSDSPGRPLLYATSPKFMDYFGIKNLSELPKPKDFKEPENKIGTEK